MKHVGWCRQEGPEEKTGPLALSAIAARVLATRHFRYWHKCEVPIGSRHVCYLG
jgi:hypothetical protein